MIVAKTVVPDQYWILQENDQKIGNIEHMPQGYSVRINDSVTVYKTMSMLREQVSVDFKNTLPTPSTQPQYLVHGYHTTETPHNSVFDIKHQLPLWTKEPRSRSWYAAGWYRVKVRRDYETVECPKFIMLERYKYLGPFKTQEAAEQAK